VLSLEVPGNSARVETGEIFDSALGTPCFRPRPAVCRPLSTGVGVVEGFALSCAAISRGIARGAADFATGDCQTEVFQPENGPVTLEPAFSAIQLLHPDSAVLPTQSRPEVECRRMPQHVKNARVSAGKG
jgi:hypothetical protein